MNIEPHILIEIAKTYGTPTYVYDLDRIKERYQYFQATFLWPGLTICYAMKAKYNPTVLQTMHSLGAFTDAGAYCYAMGGVYNLRPMLAEVVIANGHARLSRRRLTSEELIRSILGESLIFASISTIILQIRTAIKLW